MLTVLTTSNLYQRPFLAGVIEGFYGQPWSVQARMQYARLLPAMGLNSYLYCPKADPYLRRHWQQPWPQAERLELQQLARTCRDGQVSFGVGLSPFALYQCYGPEQREQLRAKVEEIASLGVSVLALLFDDMPGDVADLAERQAEIVADVVHWLSLAGLRSGESSGESSEVRLLMCPTYYSFDPVLERYFGAMPPDYWPRLGSLLANDVDIFWTGNEVCSERITRADLQQITTALGRDKVVLWDNYPVNDGAIRSKRLYLDPLADREPAPDLLAGHFCNPMNQPCLSLPALVGLGALYGAVELDAGWQSAQLGRECWSLLLRDRVRFRDAGLDGIEAPERAALAAQYAACPGAAAAEVAAWLRGEYTFDPACLTD